MKYKKILKQKQSVGKKPDKKELKRLNESDGLWCCDKQHNGEWEGRFGLWFHPETLQYLSSTDYKPRRYVDYSNSC